jgi:hypothetical protein
VPDTEPTGDTPKPDGEAPAEVEQPDLFDARIVRYPAIWDPDSGVRFRQGRATVTAEQALALAGRRYRDGVTIDGVPAKRWAAARRGMSDVPTDEQLAAEDAPPPAPDPDTTADGGAEPDTNTPPDPPDTPSEDPAPEDTTATRRRPARSN